MIATHIATVRALGCVALCAAFSLALAGTDEQKPKDLGLVEKAGRRLVQIDLSVTRRDGSSVDILPGDLEVRVGKTLIRDFTLDRICSPTAPAVLTSLAPASTPVIASYLFYFDEPHLTYAGRARALDVARELVRHLIIGGNRGIVISNGRDLLALSPLTDDASKLLAALDRLQKDTSRQDNYAEQERARADQLARAANDEAKEAKGEDNFFNRMEQPDGDATVRNDPAYKVLIAMKKAQFTHGAWKVLEDKANGLQQEEMQRAQAALERFRLALLRFTAVRAPKAVVYFADTLRLNAGEHYLQTVVKAMDQEGAFPGSKPKFSRSGGIRDVEGFFERAVAMAGNVGARIYAVQAAGMTADSLGLRDAKDALSSLALETGGKAFLEGIEATSIVGTISQDMECLYLVSFEPQALPEDQALPVRITVAQKDAVVRTRSRIVIPSEEAMNASRRLAAQLNPQANGAALTLGLVPVGFDGKKYSEMFQLAVPDGGPAGSVWAISASIIISGRIVDEFDRTVEFQQADQPLVVEHMLDLPPASYQVVAVAENTTLGTLHSGQVEAVGPEVGKDGASVTVPVALQPESGCFVRDGTGPRKSGAVVRVDGETLRAGLPTAVVAYVCRGKNERNPLQIERRLVGQTAVTFPPIALEPKGDPCAQVRDMVPATTLGDGVFQYEVNVLRGQELLVKTQKRLVVAPSASTQSSPH
jgi:VWFA-related protein